MSCFESLVRNRLLGVSTKVIFSLLAICCFQRSALGFNDGKSYDSQAAAALSAVQISDSGGSRGQVKGCSRNTLPCSMDLKFSDNGVQSSGAPRNLVGREIYFVAPYIQDESLKDSQMRRVEKFVEPCLPPNGRSHVERIVVTAWRNLTSDGFCEISGSRDWPAVFLNAKGHIILLDSSSSQGLVGSYTGGEKD